MKTRNGFVSNSSSSSFVVAFPRKPKTVEDVMLFLFGDSSSDLGNAKYQDSSLSYGDIARHVFADINGKSISKKAIMEEFEHRFCYYSPYSGFYEQRNKYCGTDEEALNGIIEASTLEEQKLQEIQKRIAVTKTDSPEYQKLFNEKFAIHNKYRAIIDRLCRKVARSDAEAFLKANEGKFIAQFSYADDCGEECTLEHGDIFHRLEYQRISHH